MSYSLARIEEFKRELLEERLALCLEEQREFFYRLFPGGPSEDKIEQALELVDRTIAKNERRNRHD